MSVNDAGGSTPVTTTVPVTLTITIAGSHSLPFENTPIVTGEGRRQIALFETPLITVGGGYQNPCGINTSVQSYVSYFVNYPPPNQQVTSLLQILSNISKYLKTNPRSFKHYIENLQVMFRIEKISEED
uniref:SEA domain-containing protein n=1 Tax=Strongyloides venezuelensis TaxID=75913 RepID=A0A0K0FHZ3_STRVS